MKKTLIFGAVLLLLSACSNAEKIQECKKISESEIDNLDGFTIENMSHSSREGLKLAVPDEYESSTDIVSISYKNSEDEYKGTTCYYDEDGNLMGSTSY